MAIANITWYAKHGHETMHENFTIQRAKWLNASLKIFSLLYRFVLIVFLEEAFRLWTVLTFRMSEN